MRGTLAAVLLTCAATVTGCGAADPLIGDLEIGSAAADGTGFVEVTEGADVELVPGAQGGFHVWTSMRFAGITGPVFVEREARTQDDGTLVLRAQRLAVDVPSDALDDWWQRPDAPPSFMCPAPVGVKIYDTPIHFDVIVTDEDGAMLAEDELVVVPRCPEGDQLAFCQSICDGTTGG